MENIDVILPYMKISVEKYIFDRTETILKAMYIYRDREIMQNFIQKKKKILSTMTK